MEAVAFAASIVTFLDFTCHVLEIGSQIRRKGLPTSQLTLDQVYKQLEEHSKLIKPPEGAQRPLNRRDQELEDLADGCDQVLKKLLSFIDKQRNSGSAGPKSKRKSLAEAIKLQWSKSEIESLCAQLDRYRAAISDHFAVETRSNSVKSIALLEDLMEEGNKNQTSTIEEMEKLRHDFGLLSSKISESSSAVHEHRQEILNIINTFIDQLRSKELFASLPSGLLKKYPHLETVAMKRLKEIEDIVLRALKFQKMSTREAGVEEAHAKTFRWLYEPPNKEDQPWDNFADWLRAGSGIYYIRGKIGSGKSTLVKFMASYSRTVELLEEWSNGHTLIVPAYFFWRAGTELQKNQVGLLRSILSQILSCRRDLIPVAFPNLYDNLIATKFPKGIYDEDIAATTEGDRTEKYGLGDFEIDELKDAFLKICRQGHKHIRVCLIIDGLDEFTGDPASLIGLLKSSALNSKMLKVIVSSRPEPIFLDSFRNVPKLRLEDLTNADMSSYLDDTLSSNGRFATLKLTNKASTDRIVTKVLSRAKGVFLWIKLVANLLLTGLAAGDHFHELEATIETYPKELKDLYRHIFESMRPEYRIQASKLFQYVFRSKELEGEPITAVRLGSIDQYTQSEIFSMPSTPLDSAEADAMIVSIGDRLRSRCCGLIEVQKSTDYTKDLSPAEGSVEFLHRTVFDFWKDRDGRASIEAVTKGNTPFDPSVDLMTSIIFQAKRLFIVKPENEKGRLKLSNSIKHFLLHCSATELTQGERQYEFLLEFDKVLSRLWRDRTWYTVEISGWVHFISRRLSLLFHDQVDEYPLLVLATYFKLITFVESWIRQIAPPDKTSSLSTILIRLITWAMCTRSKDSMTKFVEILGILLRSKYDMSVLDNSHAPLADSPWKRLLSINPISIQKSSLPAWQALEGETSCDIPSLSERLLAWLDILEAFLNAGAELDRPYEELASKSPRTVIKSRLEILESSKKQMDAEDAESESVLFRISELRARLGNTDISTRNRPRKDKHRSRRLERQKAQAGKVSHQGYEGSNAPPVSLPHLQRVNDTGDYSCSRCKILDELQKKGFTPSEAWIGLQQTNAGNDLAAITNWILDNKNTITQSTSSSGKLPSDQDIQKTRQESQTLSIPKGSQKSTQPTTSMKWSEVAKKTSQKTSPPPPETVGAAYVLKSKQKHRRGKGTSSKNGDNSSSQGSNTSPSLSPAMGEVDLGNGRRLSWAIKSEGAANSNSGTNIGITLSKDQEEMIRDIICSGFQ